MKEKGFTLIELLAVIVILPIIALIATPMILNVIEEAKQKSAIVSAENYMYGIEQYVVLQEAEKYNEKIQNNKIYRVEEETVFEVDETILSNEMRLNEIIKIKGEYPKDGYVEIGENKIVAAELVFNNYIVVCTSSTNCIITGKYSSNIVAVTSVEINEVETTEIKENETLKLSVTIKPEEATNKRIIWTSSNIEVAEVDANGLVTAKKEGTVTITATTNNKKMSKIELVVKGKYKEEILNGADPEIKSELIPVTIESDGTVTYADVTEEWYNYKNKIWANAVILKDNVTHSVGEVIPESDIKQYYVWIPRYKYELWNVNGENKYPNGTSESAINIVFESKDKEASNGTKNGEWLTHPAFTSFNTNGIWVGKYETSYDEETYTNSSKFLTSNPNYTAATNASNIIIKPNVRSLTYKSVSEFYTLGRGVNEGLNSHMMKNSEWGAVAYLTYSLYGKCTETGCEEVYLNNINTGYLNSTAKFTGQWQYGASITGCSTSSTSAGVSSNQSSCSSGYAYNGANNKASTTGNISGIYDMSGGNWEYVMGVVKDASGNPMSGRNSKYNSGFNGTYGCPTCDSDTSGLTSLTTGINFPTDTRYYDTYTANSIDLNSDIWYKYENGHLGDGNKEIAVSKSNSSSGDRGLWYNDIASFPTMAYPWVNRGGGFYLGAGAGVLGFNRGYGHAGSSDGFRVVLAY